MAYHLQLLTTNSSALPIGQLPNWIVELANGLCVFTLGGWEMITPANPWGRKKQRGVFSIWEEREKGKQKRKEKECGHVSPMDEWCMAPIREVFKYPFACFLIKLSNKVNFWKINATLQICDCSTGRCKLSVPLIYELILTNISIWYKS